MLSESWDEKHSNTRLQENLQRDLARIFTSLSSVSLPCIGSFYLDSRGYLELANRPLSIQAMMHEDEGIPLDMSRRTTFSNVKDLVLSSLAAYDNRLLGQPNAIANRDDALYQMSSLAAAKAIFPQLFRDDLCNGPFVLTLTDLHKSNIFVNEDWKITCIIDLEFACSLPVEFLEPPSWLHDEMIDKIGPEEFAPKHAKFLEHLRHEEQLYKYPSDAEPLSSIMEQAWKRGTFWVTLALRDPVAFTGIFYDCILPRCYSFLVNELNKADYSLTALLWRPNISDIIDRKLHDRDEYLKELHKVFRDTA